MYEDLGGGEFGWGQITQNVTWTGSEVEIGIGKELVGMEITWQPSVVSMESVHQSGCQSANQFPGTNLHQMG